MRLFDPPSAGFDHPLEILDGCHQRILRFSDLALKIARQIEASGVDDEVRDAARSVIRYFDDAGAKHHRDEEEDLFPALDRCATAADRPVVEALLMRLLADHRELDGHWAATREGLQSVIDGPEGRLDPDLADTLVNAYQRHIALEERELLPLAQRLLDPGTIRKLGRSMARRRGVVPPENAQVR